MDWSRSNPTSTDILGPRFLRCRNKTSVLWDDFLLEKEEGTVLAIPFPSLLFLHSQSLPFVRVNGKDRTGFT